MEKNYPKIFRVLSLYERLCKGVIIQKHHEVSKFNVDEKTIRRDIEDLRTYLADHSLHQNTGAINLVYDRKERGYLLTDNNHIWLTSKEVLVLTKIILESRALPKKELDELINKIILQCEPKEREHINQVIENERFHYVPLKHNTMLVQRIWDFSLAMREQWVVEIEYQRMSSTVTSHRLVEPQGIIFSEFYFYLLANIKGYNFNYPSVFRLDRIVNYQLTNQRFRIDYANRFEEGEFRKRVQFMTPGELMRIQFCFLGSSLEAVLDRLPTAEIISSENDRHIVEAEVFGKGIKMWLLSQGENLEVLQPANFRDEMKQTIEKMMNVYSDKKKK